MTIVWNHQFEVVVRTLRTPDAPRRTVVVEARTAAQAGRVATALYPELKVISVRRCEPTPPTPVARESEPVPAFAEVVPLRRAG